MVLNGNTLLLVISMMGGMFRGPLEWALCLDVFHPAWRFMSALQPSLMFQLQQEYFDMYNNLLYPSLAASVSEFWISCHRLDKRISQVFFVF